MYIEYYGFIATQTPEDGVKIFNRNGKLVYHYLTPNMIFNVNNLVCCIEEYMEHCGLFMWSYYDFVKIAVPRNSLPIKNVISDIQESHHGIFCNNQDTYSEEFMDPYNFVHDNWQCKQRVWKTSVK